MQTYGRLPVAFDRGDGVWLWDTHGKQYFDSICGLAVCGLGHSHPEVTAAIEEQARRLIHSSNLFTIPNQEKLADELAKISKMDRMFFSNSGAEANEAAIKIARKYGNQKGVELPSIIVMKQSFHGRTLATLTATGNRKVQAGFEPLVQGFLRVPLNDIDAVTQIIQKNKNVVAILLEPIQGEGGIHVADDEYLRQLRALCDENALLLIMDEIQSGLCRSGKWFAHQYAGIQPDVMTLAKSLGNGIPIGVCMARGIAADIFQPGNHGTTFGGNHFSTFVALRVLEILQKNKLHERAAYLGERILKKIQELSRTLPGIVAIRGRGLMLGIELDRPCKDLPKLALESGLVLNVTAERVIRLLPPLIMQDSDADYLCEKLGQLLEQYLKVD